MFLSQHQKAVSEDSITKRVNIPFRADPPSGSSAVTGREALLPRSHSFLDSAVYKEI